MFEGQKRGKKQKQTVQYSGCIHTHIVKALFPSIATLTNFGYQHLQFYSSLPCNNAPDLSN